MKFQGDRVKSFTYFEEELKIIWDDPQTADEWEKGKTFYIF